MSFEAFVLGSRLQQLKYMCVGGGGTKYLISEILTDIGGYMDALGFVDRSKEARSWLSYLDKYYKSHQSLDKEDSNALLSDTKEWMRIISEELKGGKTESS